MRASLYVSATLALATAAFPVTRPLSAQVFTGISAPCATILGVPFLPGIARRTGPFTATVRSSFEQRLADGNVLHGSSETMSARDSDGRTMQQNVRGCGQIDDAESGPRMQVSVSDPKAKTSLTWIVGPRSTHVAYLQRPETGLPRDFHPMRSPTLETFAPRTAQNSDIVTEQLGTRTIAGVEATGTRTTRVVPSGAEGNDLPMRFVHESWMGGKPRMQLMIVDDDPRLGHRVWEVVSLSLTEPDPSLFLPPQGYTVEEGKPIELPSGGVTGSTSVTGLAGGSSVIVSAGSTSVSTGTYSSPRP